MRTLSIPLCLTLLAGASPAFALNQPDGTQIPQGAGLQDLFTSRSESINALSDAATTPETFVPSCGLTFTVLQRNAGYKNSFGWYNVTGQKPSDADLHEFLACTDDVNTTKTLDIKNDPNYAGGEIGFYEGVANCASPGNYLYVFYSEKKYNPDGNQANPFVHLLIYNSTAVDKAFYFGWEDLIQGGDNDFDDLTTFVTGITCSGGGAPCDTGKPGVCKDGTMQCQSGALSCVQSTQPGTEKCDGLDNDCNGTTDEGDLCPNMEICDKGTCKPKCGGGEFVCSPNEVCTPQGLCVDAACANVTCPEGQTCKNGNCAGPCDGVTCPHGKVCRVGACVDPCGAITCDQNQVCVDGACVDSCACAGCPAGQACQPDGRCLASACVGKVCNAGEWCDVDGTCKDACTGAVCPAGETCTAGECTPAAPTGSGGSGQGGSVFVGAGGLESSSAGTGAMGGTGGMGGAGGISGGGTSGSSGSCGCKVVGTEQAGIGGLTALLAAAAAAAKRRRRR